MSHVTHIKAFERLLFRATRGNAIFTVSEKSEFFQGTSEVPASTKMVCCRVLQSVAECCSALLCVAAWCVAACCSMLQCVAVLSKNFSSVCLYVVATMSRRLQIIGLFCKRVL